MKWPLPIVGVSLMLLALLWPALMGYLPHSYDTLGAGDPVYFRMVPAEEKPEYFRWSLAVLGLVLCAIGIRKRTSGK